MKKIVIFVFILSLSISAYAGTIVLEGEPSLRAEHGINNTNYYGNKLLTNDEMEKHKLIITKENGEYFWTTNGDEPLLYNKRGSYHVFTSPNGIGYIRVDTTGEGDGTYYYMEHRPVNFEAETYWGIIEEFNP